MLLVIGAGLVIWRIFTPLPADLSSIGDGVVLTIGAGIIMIVIGALLVSKYDADKKEEKNS